VDEFLLDLLANPGQLFLGPRSAILGLLDRRLKLIDAVLDGGPPVSQNGLRACWGGSVGKLKSAAAVGRGVGAG
jgi:hypothetical protein